MLIELAHACAWSAIDVCWIDAARQLARRWQAQPLQPQNDSEAPSAQVNAE